jgi:hypothetical protein
MPYATLKKYEDEFGRSRHDYIVDGSFDELFYICPDIFRDKLENGNIVEKNESEIAREYRDDLHQIFELVGPLLDDGIIKDYWMVITPNICDSNLLKFDRPKKQNNFIVTRFNYEEIDLVEKLIIPSGNAGGTVRLSDNKRKRLATNSTLDVYVAVQINPEHPDFISWKEFGENSHQYRSAIFNLSLYVGHDTATFFNHPVRTFMSYGVRTKFEKEEIIFVEQYFDKKSKKTDGWLLGEGYVRGKLRKLDHSKLNKYVAFVDLFASTGVDFSSYGLSLEELIEYHKSFSDNPWVPIEYKN